MRQLGGIVKEITAFIVLVIVILICFTIMDKFSKLVPDNAAIQSLRGTCEFMMRLFIDWGSPDPTLWIILILFAVAGAFGVYKYLNRNNYY